MQRGVQDLPEHEDFLQHIFIQQPLKQAVSFFVESVCRDEVVLDLRLSTTKRLMGSACLRRGGKTRASQRKLGATSTSTSHSSMRRRWNMKGQLRVRQASTNAMNCFQARCVSHSTVKRAILQCHPVHWAFPLATPQHMFLACSNTCPSFLVLNLQAQ